jgi:hypothetical protein
VKIRRSQYLVPYSSGCSSAPDFLIGLTKHSYVIPRQSASVTYALLKLKCLTHRPGNTHVRTKPCDYRVTCVTYLDILIRLDRCVIYSFKAYTILIFYMSQSIYIHEECGNMCF